MKFELLANRFVHHGSQLIKGAVVDSNTPLDEVFGNETFRRIDTPTRATTPTSDPEPEEPTEPDTIIVKPATPRRAAVPSKPARRVGKNNR